MHLKLDRLEKLCQGDPDRKLKYLKQLLEIVPKGMERLQIHLETKDRRALRRAIHYLAPQLSFFGIPDFALILQMEDSQFDNLPFEELKSKLKESISRIGLALAEAEQLAQSLKNTSNP
ncbi:MAG: hypothetical protein H6560_22455 [Lewinellaceae bacterium]|nr:hypothetical protein [Lewinellaceae bacterium]